MRFLMASMLVGLPSLLWGYVGVTGLLSGWHFSRMEQPVLLALLTLMVILEIMGAILVFVPFIRDRWRLARSLWLGPPPSSRE